MAPLAPDRPKRPVVSKPWSVPTFASYQRQKRVDKPEPRAVPEAALPPSPTSSVTSSTTRSSVSEKVGAKERRHERAVAETLDQIPPAERPRKQPRLEASWMKPSLPKLPPPRARDAPPRNRNANDQGMARRSGGRRGTEILTGKDLAAQLAAITGGDNTAYTPPRREKRDVRETKAVPVLRPKPPPRMPAWMTPARIDPPPPAMEQSAPSTHKMVTRQRAARGAGVSPTRGARVSRARDLPTPGPTAEDEEDDDGFSIAYWKAQIEKVPDERGVGDNSQAGWDQGRTGFNLPEQSEHINAAFEECFLLDPALAVEESQGDDGDLVFVGDQDFAFLEDEDLAFLEDEDF